jgi:hypothetical protein
MAFPNNPSNGDTFVRYGRTYQYDSTMLMWKVPKSGIQLTELSDIDITTTTPVTGDALVWSGTKFEPDNINILSVYQSELPLAGNVAGQMAYVTDTSRLYIYTGAGWFNVALVNTNPTITVGPDGGYAFATDGTPIVLTLEAQDPEEVPIAWSYVVTSGVLGSTATVQQEGNVFTITPSTNSNDGGEFSITFTASDGVNIATSVSAFTLLFGVADQYYNKTSLLLKSGSTAGLDNNTFVDESTNGFTVTPTGDVYQGSLSPYSPAGWSAYFDGAADYLTTSSSAQQFGTGDFTIEMWAYPTSVPSAKVLIDFRSSSGSSSFGQWYIDTNLRVHIYTPNPDIATTNSVALNSWNHIALTRSAGTLKIFINGVQGVSTSFTSSVNAGLITIGAGVDNYASSAVFIGYMSDIRFVGGTALYTADFTPPTEPLTAISGTSLLTCQSNRFIDNSTNNFTVSRYGDTKAVPFSPYLPSKKYDPTVHGGSAYFDGAGNYLTMPTGTNLDVPVGGDFTVEGWAFLNSKVAAYPAFFSNYNSFGAGSIALFAGHNGSSQTKYHLSFNGTFPRLTSTSDILYGQWNHFAITRESSTIRMFINGILEDSVLDSRAVGHAAAALWLGATADDLANSQINGYMSNFRWISGTALYTSSFTPPTEPLTAISGTSLLLNMNNAGIYDETAKNDIQLIGNSTTSTTQTKFADTSVYFDGTGDYVTSSTTAGVMGTGNFTIETWFYPTTSGTNRCIINTRTADGSTTGFYLGLTSLQYAMFYVPGVGSVVSSSNSILADSWYHIAVVRNANIVNLYLNGVSVGSSTIGSNFTDTLFQIGGCPNVPNTSANYFSGYLEDFRITNGVARYTANFTPPTAPLGFSNAE